MQNYVISLKSAVLRRKHIEKTFSSQQIDFRFFDAFDFSEGGESLIDQLIPNLNQTALTRRRKTSNGFIFLTPTVLFSLLYPLSH
ncbi:glycosyltransferase family 25 protein [Actinobacillus seminis]|uniref:glycosyltransferase family 25 protein n=1 Tax=Actinobacillus seminis TaxID=722 RepID=UPI003B947E9C